MRDRTGELWLYTCHDPRTNKKRSQCLMLITGIDRHSDIDCPPAEELEQWWTTYEIWSPPSLDSLLGSHFSDECECFLSSGTNVVSDFIERWTLVENGVDSVDAS